jgi:hypothetical protein
LRSTSCTQDTVRTWAPAWSAFRRDHTGSLTAWSSAIRYRTKENHMPSSPLGRALLDRTTSGHDDMLDIVLGTDVAV